MTRDLVHPFDAAMQLEPAGAGSSPQAQCFAGHTSAAYANIIGPYGGITAAQALQAVLQHPDLQGEPVSFTGNFLAALADGAFVIEAWPVRTNRSTQHWMVLIRQRDDSGRERAVFSATVMTAIRRQTWGATELAMPEVPPPEDGAPARMDGAPAWIHRYEFRWLAGAMPEEWNDSIRASSLTRMWVREAQPRTPNFPSLLAMCDVFYPRIWLKRARRVPMGTVSFTAYLHVGASALAACAGQHVLAQARGQAFHDGYFDHAGALWNQQGQLLATTHQLVYYRE